jgi:DnaJ-domain-containing protein 1
MDAVAALAAPRLHHVSIGGLSEFLGRRGLRVVHAHDGAPFGLVLKMLLHGRLGSELRCGRLDLRAVDGGSDAARSALQPWINLAGLQGEFPPPPGYYLFRGPTLVGYHPELDVGVGDASRIARLGARGLMGLARARDLDRAGRDALVDAPELDVLAFFEETAQGWTPRRAPSAADRRARRDRRAPGRGTTPRRARERLEAEVDAAFRLLGVSPDAPLRRVKAARNRLMRDNHPDRLMHDPHRHAEATRLTVRINEAYSAIRRLHEGDPAP